MKWPDLRALDIAIAIQTDDGTRTGKQTGIALMIPSSENRTRGMNLLKYGFKNTDNDGKYSIYVKDTKEAFRVSDIQKWIPEFNKNMMADVDERQVISDLRSLLSYNQSDDDILDMIEEHFMSKNILPYEPPSRKNDTFTIIANGYAICSNESYLQKNKPSKKAVFAAMVEYYRNTYRVERLKNSKISERDARINAINIINSGENSFRELLLRTLDWIFYRFGGHEIESANMVIEAIKKEKKGMKLLKPIEKEISRVLEVAQRNIDDGLYMTLDDTDTEVKIPLPS